MCVIVNKRLDFGRDPDHDADPEFLKESLFHCGIWI